MRRVSRLLGVCCALLGVSTVNGCGASHDVEDAEHDAREESLTLSSASLRVTDDDAGTELTDAGVSAPEYPALSLDQIGQPVALTHQFEFPEGPAWSDREQALYFTDIPASIIYRLRLPDTLEVAIEQAGSPDGLAFDPQGRLLVAGFGARNVWRWDGERSDVLAAQHEGARLNSPDDLIARADTTIYFTDPTYGINGSTGLPRQAAELDFEGVFRIAPDGSLHLEDDGLSGPNGIGLSPDERTLYVSSTVLSSVYAYTVQPDGSLSDRRVLASGLLGADSLCLDAAGNLYVATATGITLLSPEGDALGTLSLPSLASNVGFGGPDKRTLFITARSIWSFLGRSNTGRLYRIDDMPIPGIGPRSRNTN